MSALRLINETEITSSVSSVDVTDVFSADFDIYKIVTSDISTVSTTPANVNLRFINSSGSVISASNYDRALLRMRVDTAFAESRATNGTGYENAFGYSDGSPEAEGSVVYVFNPYNASSYTFGLNQAFSPIDANTSIFKGIGVLKQTVLITGFQLYTSQNVNSGFIRTYGLRVDNG
jgi:hypothetical protein